MGCKKPAIITPTDLDKAPIASCGRHVARGPEVFRLFRVYSRKASGPVCARNLHVPWDVK